MNLRRRGPGRGAGGSARTLAFETLESRRLLVAEGVPVSISQPIEAISVTGAVSAQIDWGDGTIDNASFTPVDTTGPISVVFDYRFAGGFYNSTVRARLQQAADLLVKRFTDSLTAIAPGGGATWTAVIPNPNAPNFSNFFDPSSVLKVTDLPIPANQIVIFPGTADLPGTQIGLGVYGGFENTTIGPLADAVIHRGQAGSSASPPTDFAPWGGMISFDTNLPNSATWYFGADAGGIGPNQIDFVTVAMHELAHVLGVGVAPSWNTIRSGANLIGPASRAVFGGNVPLTSDGLHFNDSANGVGDNVFNPVLPLGRRVHPTALDFAAMDDLGWDLDRRLTTVTGQHAYGTEGQYDAEVILRGTIGEIRVPVPQTVTNVEPSLTTPASAGTVVGSPLQITSIGTITDPGFLDTFTYSIDWGDGSARTTGNATIDVPGGQNVVRQASFDGSKTYSQTGTFTVTVTVSDGVATAANSFPVTVSDAPSIRLSLVSDTISESDGPSATTLRVSRSGGILQNPLSVGLSNSQPSEISIPSLVEIPAGADFVDVPVNAVDDDLLDGTQVFRVTASGLGLAAVAITISVTDDEQLDGTFTDGTVTEGDSASITVSRSNTDTAAPLNIDVTSSSSRFVVPTVLTIPAGQMQVTTQLNTVDDAQQQKPESVTVTLSADGYQSATGSILVRDNEPAFHQNPSTDPLSGPGDVDDNGQVAALDALRILNLLLPVSEGFIELFVETTAPILFPDTNGDYFVTPIDALVVINILNRRGGSGELLSADPIAPAGSAVDRVFASDDEDEESIFHPLLRLGL